MVSADTAASPDERYTYGSQSIEQSCLDAGEASLAPVSAAIANAVASATGHRFGDLPICRTRVSEALRS
jgi:hypothetical protein